MAYIFNNAFNGLAWHSFYISGNMGYQWNIRNIIFPSFSVGNSYKTGAQPNYAMAEKIRGIIDTEWKGNGVYYINCDCLFRIFIWPGTLFMHLGPFVDYGISYGHNQEFLATDQGAGIGVRIRLLSPLFPSAPVFIDFGYDLRDKYDPLDRRRFEFHVGNTLRF